MKTVIIVRIQAIMKIKQLKKKSLKMARKKRVYSLFIKIKKRLDDLKEIQLMNLVIIKNLK